MTHTVPTASYPAAVLTDASIGLQTNREERGLMTQIDASVLVIVTSGPTAALPASGIITIEDERIKYDGLNTSTNTFTVQSDGRGWDGSTPAAHSAGKLVRFNHTAYPINRLIKEMEATQTALGANLGNVPTNSRQVIAGAGLTGGGSLATDVTLDANVDGSTIEIVADTIQVKDGGITTAKLSFDVTTQAELDSHATNVSTHGVTGNIVGTLNTQTLHNKTLGTDLDAGGFRILGLASIGIDGSAAATTPGTVVKKLPIYDQMGVLLGYLPIYDAIA